MAYESEDVLNEGKSTSGKDHITTARVDIVGGDKIVVGDIYGSYVAIGRGAQVIVQRVLSAAEEAEKLREFESGILARAVVDYLEKLRAQIPPSEQLEENAEPYKSLLPYRLADAPLFFGRDQATAELLTGVGSKSRGWLTVLHSESGAGKTSLLQAGLAANVLADGHLPLYVRAWRGSPTLAIKQTLLPNLGQTPKLAQASLRAFLFRVTEVLGPSSVLFILLDQFEEFFTRVPDEETRNNFIEELGDCLEDEMLRALFVLSLHKDHFADLIHFRARIPHIFANEYSLKLLTRAEAASVITEPAALVGLTYEAGLVDEILDELHGDDQKATMPAQLQLVCWTLYRGLSGEQQVITHTALEQMGGVPGILRNYLQRVIGREIPAGQREQAQHVLEALVRPDRTRDIKTEAEIARDAGPAQTLPRVLSDLVNSRLLRVVEASPDEETAYELAHDYLIQQIELDPEVLARKAAQELLDQEAAAWQRNPKFLIGEEKLRVIKAQESKIHFSPEAKELYEKSKRARRRRRGVLLGLFSLALLISCVAFLLYKSWTIATENLRIAKNALVTATSIVEESLRITEAEDQGNETAKRQATAEIAAQIAQTTQSETVAAEATASMARQTDEAAKRQDIAGIAAPYVQVGSLVFASLVVVVFSVSRLRAGLRTRQAIERKFNPYISGDPVREPDMFFGREELLKRIINTLHNNSIMIHGPRRMGKTSLLYQLADRLRAALDPDYAFIPALIDLEGTAQAEFFHTLMEEILEDCQPYLTERLPLVYNEKNEGVYTHRDFARDLRTLIDHLQQNSDKEARLILLLDEVDVMNRYDQLVQQQLRRIFMKTFARSLGAVVAGVHISKEWDRLESPWYNLFLEMELLPLSREEAVRLIKEPVKGIYSYEDEAVEAIWEYSQGHPQRVQQLCLEAVNRLLQEKRSRVTKADVESVYREIVAHEKAQEEREERERARPLVKRVAEDGPAYEAEEGADVRRGDG